MRGLDCRLPHRVEELLLDDFAILNRVETCLVHSYAFSHVFGRDVIFESHNEAVAMGEWSFGYTPMDFVVIYPPLILAFDFRDSPLGLFHTRHSDGFDALDIRRVESIDRLLIFTLFAQVNQFLADLHCRHDASSSFYGGDGLSVLLLMPIH
jgi:hypothetical protein